jgi:hypothetical protein
MHISHTEANLQEVLINGEVFYMMSNVQDMRPFFMSIVSDSNHWMFISSNGGLTAGRKNPEYALFPYYTDDKITESAEMTGSKTILRIEYNGKVHVWEPFSARTEAIYSYTRNIYKNRYGNTIIFEEKNQNLNISFQYRWCSSDLYGFVRLCSLINHNNERISMRVLDGLQNILPYGVGSELQTKTSNLADAYKRSELITDSGLGIFALSAIIVDKAEPSEALKANVVWSLGFENPVYLLSSKQLRSFRKDGSAIQESDVKGEKGCYFNLADITLEQNTVKQWMMVADVNLNHSAIARLSSNIKTNAKLAQEVLEDIHTGTIKLTSLVAAADGIQSTADRLKDTRHFSNVLFNIMRGGIFDNGYKIEKWDFCSYLKKANQQVFKSVALAIDQLPETFSVTDIKKIAASLNHIDFTRLVTEYLPLKFSRRHGDPSRPWNQFSINTRSELDGSKILDYQGNWRDIFQNWEALAHSYPEFIEGMIWKFLNASTFDGYNPYRVTKDGFDWETIEPDNPWSYIGYWGDHQVIYLLKFLEFIENHKPGHLTTLMSQEGFVYANVPYIIKEYASIVKNPKDTIDFDHKKDRIIHERLGQIGTDGALLFNKSGEIYHVCFAEKILALVLSKLSNFVPDGGIWMNTQRPEWNDANNALVGNGLSMVTLCYLRRFLEFFNPILQTDFSGEVSVSKEIGTFFSEVSAVFSEYHPLLSFGINDIVRKKMTDALGMAGSRYRAAIYNEGFSGNRTKLSKQHLADCFRQANDFLNHAIAVNKRPDHLFHTYNLISYHENGVEISHLSEMLEGQVAVLSSGMLTSEECVVLLDALKSSSLYRADQNSYVLYPNKDLPGFTVKNNIPLSLVQESALLLQLLDRGDTSIVEKDINGDIHFNGNFRNATDLEKALHALSGINIGNVEIEGAKVLQIFEEVFRHKEFTGRSGTFFGFEGLGSIYWHMVSKLLLAVMEATTRMVKENAPKNDIDRIVQHFHDINDGIGVHKPPAVYGAFPTDPYSHTPFGKGAQQPGMTGQVKEDIISRFGELGVCLSEGKLKFLPTLLKKTEFSNGSGKHDCVTINNIKEHIATENQSLLFTICQVPIVYIISDSEKIEVLFKDGLSEMNEGTELSLTNTVKISKRTGEITRVNVFVSESRFR